MNSKTYTLYAQHADEEGREIVAIAEVPASTHGLNDTAAVAVLCCEFAPPSHRYELVYMGTGWEDTGHSYPRLTVSTVSAPCEHKDLPDSYYKLNPALAAMAQIAADAYSRAY